MTDPSRKFSETVIEKLAQSAEDFDKRKFYILGLRKFFIFFNFLIPHYRQVRFINS